MRRALFLALLFISKISAQTYITHMQYIPGINGSACGLGRMGDQLIAYSKAKWFSHKYSIPYLYYYFPYSEHFHLADKEPHAIGKWTRIKEKKCKFDEKEASFVPQDNTCYLVDFFYTSPSWSTCADVGEWKDMLSDAEFRAHLREMLSPKDISVTLDVPMNVRTVALHIRKGSYFDIDGFFSEQEFSLLPDDEPGILPLKKGFMDVGEPYKFPPNQYYIDQLKLLAQEFQYEPLHVVLFTDYAAPDELLATLERAVDLPMITYQTAPEVVFTLHGERLAPGVDSSLRDLLLMTQCDCLIRSGSNFAQIAHLMGDFDIVYYPLDAEWYGNRLTYKTIGCSRKQ